MDTPHARKRFGQNFLIDSFVIDQIIGLINPAPQDNFVEIGPGRGALTGPLVESGAQTTVIEIDRDLANAMRESRASTNNLNVVQGDALQVDYRDFYRGKSLRVVGNLPYNISTPLILKLISEDAAIKNMTFMLQKEVVDRLAAIPGTKDYGRLSVMVQSSATVTSGFDVEPTAFDTVPKVMSKLVVISPQYPRIPIRIRENLEHLVRVAFGQRRKTIKNTLGKQVPEASLEKAGINVKSRPEEIDVAAFIALARVVATSP